LVQNDEGTCPICRKVVPAPDGKDTCAAVQEYGAPEVEAMACEADATAGTVTEVGAADLWQEHIFHEATALLRGPEPAASRSGLVLVLSLLAFVAAGNANWPARELAILVGVLFFHELGHWLGMQLFGYQNVKMFFLPFFGAAVSGKKVGAPQWQEAIVYLLGPIPGLLVGCGLLFLHLLSPNPLLFEIAKWLVWINAFNLLPLEPLDGGRLLNLLIFSRHQVLESVFVVVTSLLVLGLGVRTRSWLFAGLGVFGLLMVPARYRIARMASLVRERWPLLPSRIADAPESVLRDIFREVTGSLRNQPNTAKVAAVAPTMRAVYERSLVRPVSLLGTIPLLAAYLGGIFLFFVWLVMFTLEGIRAAGG
jgi:Zn-dependent protease